MAGEDHYKAVPNLPDKVSSKKKRPKIIAFVDEDNCTGCQACVPFCPVDCIEPVAKTKYHLPIPPVQIRFNECIGCQICARVCTKMTWDAIRMLPTETIESRFSIKISESFTPTPTESAK